MKDHGDICDIRLSWENLPREFDVGDDPIVDMLCDMTETLKRLRDDMNRMNEVLKHATRLHMANVLDSARQLRSGGGLHPKVKNSHPRSAN